MNYCERRKEFTKERKNYCERKMKELRNYCEGIFFAEGLLWTETWGTEMEQYKLRSLGSSLNIITVPGCFWILVSESFQIIEVFELRKQWLVGILFARRIKFDGPKWEDLPKCQESPPPPRVSCTGFFIATFKFPMKTFSFWGAFQCFPVEHFNGKMRRTEKEKQKYKSRN